MAALADLMNEMSQVQLKGNHVQRKASIMEIAKRFWGTPELAKGLLVEFQHGLLKNPMQGVRATFNPNGFTKIRIASVGKSTLRLHVHSLGLGIPDGGRVEENAHDHRWSLNSTLICGQIQHTIMGFSSDGEEYYQYSYYPRGDRSYFTMNLCGVKKLKKLRNFTPQAFVPLKMDSYVVPV